MLLKLFRHTFVLICGAILALGTQFASAEDLSFTGTTMGTTYHIKVVGPCRMDSNALQIRIDQRLEQLNQSMSTYRPDSEISRFNQWRAIDSNFDVSTDFLTVMLAADAVYGLTNGAWDCTIDPLVDLWGFGRSGPITKMPSAQAVSVALKNVGFNLIEVSAKGFLKKRQPNVTIDLASIAKGYGVDQVAQLFESLGLKNYLVEIGGEVYAAGRRSNSEKWRVGINRPVKFGDMNSVYKVLELENQAMATSGDYRNFEVLEGRTVSHIIDPRTGYPVSNGVVSASVVAPNCTLADGLATALMVMGPEKGVSLLNRLEAVEGLIVVQTANSHLINHWSGGLKVEQ